MFVVKSIGDLEYIEFHYLISDLFEKVRMGISYHVANLVTSGEVKDPDAVMMTADEEDFFDFSCESAGKLAYAEMAPLGRELDMMNTVDWDKLNNKYQFRVVKKSTINEALLNSWDTSLEQYMVRFVQRDWYNAAALSDGSNFDENAVTFQEIVNQRMISDMGWLVPTTIEEAKNNCATSLHDWLKQEGVIS